MVLSLLLCFLPVIIGLIVLKFCNIKVTHSLIAVLAAIIVILPISLIQFFTSSFRIPFLLPTLNVLLKSFLIYGLIEETLKGLTIAVISPKIGAKDSYSISQNAALALFFGLTLGCFESEIYFISHLMQAKSWGATLMYKPILLRMVTTDFLHAFCACISGIYVYKWIHGEKHKLFIFTPVLIHTAYDFFAGFQNNLKFFSIAVILYAALKCHTILAQKDEDKSIAA